MTLEFGNLPSNRDSGHPVKETATGLKAVFEILRFTGKAKLFGRSEDAIDRFGQEHGILDVSTSVVDGETPTFGGGVSLADHLVDEGYLKRHGRGLGRPRKLFYSLTEQGKRLLESSKNPK